MLKDITLGQYFPGKSFIHKLDPRSKLFFVMLFLVATFMAKSVFAFALLVFAIVFFVLLSRVPLRIVLKGLKPLVIIVLFICQGFLFFGCKFIGCIIFLQNNLIFFVILLKSFREKFTKMPLKN